MGACQLSQKASTDVRDTQQATAAVAEDLSGTTHSFLIKLHISYHDIHKPCLYGILLSTHVTLLLTHVTYC